MPAENSEQPEQRRKLPERADALTLDLPFDEALKAALETAPPKTRAKRRPGGTRREAPKRD